MTQSKDPSRDVVRARFIHVIRIGTVETDVWLRERSTHTCTATAAGLVFEFAPATVTIVPYTNVIAYDIAK